MSHEAQEADANLAEIARLHSDLAGLQGVLEQKERALVAAHRAVEMAQADVGALRESILISLGVREHELWYLRGHLAELLSHSHPGASLLAELDAARKVVEKWRYMPRYYDDCDPGQNDPYYAWWAEMDDLVAAYDAAAKARGE